MNTKELCEVLNDLQTLTDDKLVFKSQEDGTYQIKIKKLGKGKHTYGTKLIRKLNSHSKTITIHNMNTAARLRGDGVESSSVSSVAKSDGFKSQNGPRADSVILFNPNYESQNGERPSFIGLAHELIHASHNADGTAYHKKINGKSYEEERTVGLDYNEGDEPTENHIRREHGLPERPEY